MCEALQHRAEERYHERAIIPAQNAVDQAIAARDVFKTTLSTPRQTTSGWLLYELTTGWSFQTLIQDVGLSFRVVSCMVDGQENVHASAGSAARGSDSPGSANDRPASLDSGYPDNGELYLFEEAMRKCKFKLQYAIDHRHEFIGQDRLYAKANMVMYKSQRIKDAIIEKKH